MVNPRIVKGRLGTDVVLAVRAHVLDTGFLIGIDRDSAAKYPRVRLEDRLLQEARSLMGLAGEEGFDFRVHHFELNRDFGVWEKTLSSEDLDRLMRD